MDGYKKNGAPENARWKTNQDEFRGYMRAKMEEMHNDSQNLWKAHRTHKKEMEPRFTKLEQKGQITLGIIIALQTVAWGIIITKQIGLW